jgi:hypothetical protein
MLDLPMKNLRNFYKSEDLGEVIRTVKVLEAVAPQPEPQPEPEI